MPHYDGETMPRNDQDFRDYIARKFREGDERMERIELNNAALSVKMDQNAALANSIKADTAGLVQIWTIGENTTKAGEIVGKLAIWIVKVAIALGVIWAGFKFGIKQ